MSDRTLRTRKIQTVTDHNGITAAAKRAGIDKMHAVHFAVEKCVRVPEKYEIAPFRYRFVHEHVKPAPNAVPVSVCDQYARIAETGRSKLGNFATEIVVSSHAHDRHRNKSAYPHNIVYAVAAKYHVVRGIYDRQKPFEPCEIVVRIGNHHELI